MDHREAWHGILPWAALLVAAIAMVAWRGGSWSWDHSHPVNWDEGHYLTFAYRDCDAFRTDGIKRLLANFVYDDPGRPPAYRLLAAPLDLPFGVNLVALRLEGLIVLLLTLGLVFAAVFRVTNSLPASLVSALLPLLSPLVIEQSMHFGTEASLYLATSATICFLLWDWDNPRPRRFSWALLGLALGLGALTKMTFGIVGGGLLLLAGVGCAMRIVRGPGLAYLLKSAALGGILALPWWLHNAHFAFAFASYSMDFRRHSLGPLDLGMAAHYLLNVSRFTCGFLPTLLVVSAVAAGSFQLWNHMKRPASGDGSAPQPVSPRASLAIIIILCMTAGMVLLAQLLTSNHEPRLVTPVAMLLATAAGIGLAQTNWLIRATPACVITLLLAMPLFVLASPVPFGWARQIPILGTGSVWPFRQVEMWDYDRIYGLCAHLGHRNPVVGVLGNSFTLNIGQVRAAWASHGENARCTQLWRWERRNFSMEEVVEKARRCDMVLTAPALVGETSEGQNRDNQYNAAFAKRLEADADFEPPQRLIMGQLKATCVLVFLNRPK